MRNLKLNLNRRSTSIWDMGQQGNDCA